MRRAGGTIRVDEALDRTTASGGDDLEERPFADARGTRYRVLLKGTDANAMRRAVESMTTRLAQQGVSRNAINAEWPEAATQITLVPRAGVAAARAAQSARLLAERTMPPRRRALPDGRTIVAAGADAPRSDDDVPRAADLFARSLPMTVDAAFDVRHEPVSGRVTRELGRFVLPVEISPSGNLFEQLLDSRMKIDRTLSLMSLSPGVVLRRPALGAWDFSAEKLRLFGLAAPLPSLLGALAATALSSLSRAPIALAPAGLAVACASPALIVAGAPMDEVVLLAIGAAVCCITALATIGMLHFARVAATYRTMRAMFLPCAIASLAGAAMTAMAGTGGGGLAETWQAPLLASCVVFGIGGCALLLPAAIANLTRGDGVLPWDARKDGRLEAASPAGWKPALLENQPALLEIQNVTKVYAGGFRALHRISFVVEPGVIGLLGPNGAGKTTLLRIITGLLLPSRGTVRYSGVDVRPQTLAAYRRRIGFLPQEFNAYAGLTAAQFLDYWTLEHGIAAASARRREVTRLLAIARLEAHADRKLP